MKKEDLMLRSVKSLTGFAIGATDGEIGKVKDIYFDDQTWKVRYLVVETGSWLFGRKVLLSPMALQPADMDAKHFPTNLTTDQVKNSPDIDTDKPVSIQQEEQLHLHYLWPQQMDGGIGFMTTGMMGGIIAPDVPLEDRLARNMNSDGTINDDLLEPEPLTGDQHLRSFDGSSGYTIHGTDGEYGTVYDFLVEDTTWSIPKVVIKAGGLFENKKIVIPTTGIEKIDWASSAVYVNHTLDFLKYAPEFNPDQLDLQNSGIKLS
jgi:sporulation protein YlmC with PRC-barrel domain